MLLAHDLGTTGDKTSVHDDTGALVAGVTVGYPTNYGRGGVAEQDPEHWWDAVCRATTELLARTGIKAAEITAVGFSGQMMGAVLLDGHLRPVRPAMIWADHRSGRQADMLLERIGLHDAYEATGHRINPTYSLTKVMWTRDNEAEAFAVTRHVCQAKDYIVARLTGQLATDPSDASSTNAYDQRAGTWSEDPLQSLSRGPTLRVSSTRLDLTPGDLRLRMGSGWFGASMLPVRLDRHRSMSTQLVSITVEFPLITSVAEGDLNLRPLDVD